MTIETLSNQILLAVAHLNHYVKYRKWAIIYVLFICKIKMFSQSEKKNPGYTDSSAFKNTYRTLNLEHIQGKLHEECL